MANVNETYPFQVSIWDSGNGNPRSLFEKGRWIEYAHCSNKRRAEEVALCLSCRNPQGVQVAEFDEHRARFVGYKFYPESARAFR